MVNIYLMAFLQLYSFRQFKSLIPERPIPSRRPSSSSSYHHQKNHVICLLANLFFWMVYLSRIFFDSKDRILDHPLIIENQLKQTSLILIAPSQGSFVSAFSSDYSKANRNFSKYSSTRLSTSNRLFKHSLKFSSNNDSSNGYFGNDEVKMINNQFDYVQDISYNSKNNSMKKSVDVGRTETEPELDHSRDDDKLDDVDHNIMSSSLQNIRRFPFTMVVNQKEIKNALLLSVINPRMGGVIISGGHGTGKSVLARAMQHLLPTTMEIVKGSSYNIDPKGFYGIDSLLLADLKNSGKNISDLDTETVSTPFVQIPLNVMEDSLVGTVDLDMSISLGKNIFSPGLLAKSHRGILYVDDVNLLDDDITAILFDVISEGFVKVEREGVSVKYPCRPILIATFNPEEGEVRQHLLDRIAVSLSADANQLTVEERVEAVTNVLKFTGDEPESKNDDVDPLQSIYDEENKLKQQIRNARDILNDVKISHSQIKYLCEEATRSGCIGQRAEIFATEIAKTNAAFYGRKEVNAEDLRSAVFLAIAPRSTFFLTDSDAPESDEDIPSQDKSEYEGADKFDTVPPEPMQKEDTSATEDENPQEEENHDDEQEETQKEEELQFEIPDEFMFGVNFVPIDPQLLDFAKWARKGKGGKRSRMYNLERGRFVKPVFPQGTNQGRIAVGATLRAAAPHQKLRRDIAEGKNQKIRHIYIDKSDYRIKKMSKKSGSLVIFVVDASGSMAMNRMDAAKGAAISLLAEAYKGRDKISLISFHGEQAQVIVPPTKSIALTRRRLEGMPCGGGSPLAHALSLATRTGLNTLKIKKDVSRVIIVLLTDGRANIPLSISIGKEFDPSSDPSSLGVMPSKSYLKEEVIQLAKRLGSLTEFSLLVIDTEDQYVSTGIAEDIASASSGRYFRLTRLDKGSIRSATKEVIRTSIL